LTENPTGVEEGVRKKKKYLIASMKGHSPGVALFHDNFIDQQFRGEGNCSPSMSFQRIA